MNENQTPTPAGVDQSVWEAQTDLRDLIDSFNAQIQDTRFTDGLNRLLYKWHTNPALNLSRSDHQQELRTIHSIIELLVNIKKLSDAINLWTDEVDEKEGLSQDENVIDEPVDFGAFPGSQQAQLKEVVKAAHLLADQRPELSVRVLHRSDYLAVVVFSAEPERPVLFTSQDFYPDWMGKYPQRAFKLLRHTCDILGDIHSDTDKWLTSARRRHGLLTEADVQPTPDSVDVQPVGALVLRPGKRNVSPLAAGRRTGRLSGFLRALSQPAKTVLDNNTKQKGENDNE